MQVSLQHTIVGNPLAFGMKLGPFLAYIMLFSLLCNIRLCNITSAIAKQRPAELYGIMQVYILTHPNRYDMHSMRLL